MAHGLNGPISQGLDSPMAQGLHGTMPQGLNGRIAQGLKGSMGSSRWHQMLNASTAQWLKGSMLQWLKFVFEAYPQRTPKGVLGARPGHQCGGTGTLARFPHVPSLDRAARGRPDGSFSQGDALPLGAGWAASGHASCVHPSHRTANPAHPTTGPQIRTLVPLRIPSDG